MFAERQLAQRRSNRILQNAAVDSLNHRTELLVATREPVRMEEMVKLKQELLHAYSKHGLSHLGVGDIMCSNDGVRPNTAKRVEVRISLVLSESIVELTLSAGFAG